MKNPTGSECAPIHVAVLSLSPIGEDHVTLERIFHESAWAAYTNCRWTLHRRATLSSALQLLKQEPIPIVVCESNLLPGTWRDMLERIAHLPNPHLQCSHARLTMRTTSSPVVYAAHADS